MRVLTWNVAGRVRRLPEQAQVVGALGADVVALQEVTARTLPLWREALAAAGLPHVACGLEPPGAAGAPAAGPPDAAAPPPARGGRRRLGVLTAAREPLERLPSPGDVPWPERLVAVRTGGVEVVNLHSPIAPAPDLAKVRTHEAVARWLAALPAAPRILCGDLNTPRRELPDGDVLTFAHASSGKLRPERGERWDAAERALVHDMRARHGWTDAYRALHGFGERSASWTFSGDKGGWRLDHLLVRDLDVLACDYAHEWRRAGLSDHSALVADVR